MMEIGDFKIKIGLNKVEEGADNLVSVCQDIVNNGEKVPMFKCFNMV